MTTSYKHLTPLVDGDILVYRCGFAADSQIKNWYKENVNPEATPEELAEHLAREDYLTHALGNVKTMMDGFADLFNHDTMRVFLTGHGNFREQIATLLPYKGNRDKLHKPKYYDDIRRYLCNVWRAEVIDGHEADDAIASAQWVATDDSTVSVSIDKDLNMIPGNHYNPVTKELYYVEQEEADLALFYQMLVGDRTDNIPGIDKIGDKRASDLINEHGRDVDRVREAVKEKYRQQYGPDWEAAYHEVGALLWMRRDPDSPYGQVDLL